MELHRGKNLTSGPRPESVGTSRQVSRPDSVWGLQISALVLRLVKNWLILYLPGIKTSLIIQLYQIRIKILESIYQLYQAGIMVKNHQPLYRYCIITRSFLHTVKAKVFISTAATTSRFIAICFQEAGIKTIFIAEFHCLHRLLTLSIKR